MNKKETKNAFRGLRLYLPPPSPLTFWSEGGGKWGEAPP